MKDMYIRRESAGYTRLIRRMAEDDRLAALHVSLFTALFVLWQHSGFQRPFSVSRRKLMDLSKIASIATYHKCIRQLDACGYIRYQPSYHPQRGSLIYWPGDT